MRSLRSLCTGPLEPWGVPGLILTGIVLLGLGLSYPVIDLSTVAGLGGGVYSIWEGVTSLARGGHPGLAALVFVFSFLFPVIKYAGMLAVWFRPLPPDRQQAAVRLLDRLGRWSMLDVFVVVILMGVVHFGWLADVTPAIGVYFFGASILLSILVIQRIARIARLAPARWRPDERTGPATPWIGLAGLACLAAGWYLPLLHSEKWHFWKRDFSLVEAVPRMAGQGYILLTGLVVVSVLVIPVTRILVTVLLWWMGRRAARDSRVARLLEIVNRWAMLEVLALALLVVSVKVGDLVAVEARAGLWCYLVAMGLSAALDLPAIRWVRRLERWVAG